MGLCVHFSMALYTIFEKIKEISSLIFAVRANSGVDQTYMLIVQLAYSVM